MSERKWSRNGWGVSVIADPWFNLGFHLDHREPYIALHLPGVRIEIGRETTDPVHVASFDEPWTMWLLSERAIPDRVRTAVKEALAREGGP